MNEPMKFIKKLSLRGSDQSSIDDIIYCEHLAISFKTSERQFGLLFDLFFFFKWFDVKSNRVYCAIVYRALYRQWQQCLKV